MANFWELWLSPVYEFLGQKPLSIKELPKEKVPAFGTLGYYMSSGIHDVIWCDWEQFIAFANFNFKK